MRIFISLLSILFSLSAVAADANQYLEGRDFTMLESPVPTLNPHKIEVVEAFSFTCPHCFRFEPLIEEWQKKQLPDVAFVPMHMQWSEGMKSYQRGFYTAVSLKIQNQIRTPAFNMIHKENKAMETAEAWADLFSTFGINKKTTIATYNSFITSDMMMKADARVKALKISSTPELAIEGKYIISTPSGMNEADAHKKMLDIADFLVAQVRAERAAKRH